MYGEFRSLLNSFSLPELRGVPVRTRRDGLRVLVGDCLGAGDGELFSVLECSGGLVGQVESHPLFSSGVQVLSWFCEVVVVEGVRLGLASVRSLLWGLLDHYSAVVVGYEGVVPDVESLLWAVNVCELLVPVLLELGASW